MSETYDPLDLSDLEAIRKLHWQEFTAELQRVYGPLTGEQMARVYAKMAKGMRERMELEFWGPDGPPKVPA